MATESKQNRVAKEQAMHRADFLLATSVDQFDNLISSEKVYYLRVDQNVVYATCNTASDSWVLYLPPVAECRGMIFCVYATVANSKNISVRDRGDSIAWTNLALATDEDAALLYCDGRKWWVLSDDIA